MLDKIVSSLMPVTPNFTKRTSVETGEVESSVLKRQYVREHSAFSFQQLLSSYSLMEPKVVREYYPLDDSLVIALVWPPPQRRIGKDLWNPSLW